MSISKLFVKVFKENIFEHLDNDNSDFDDDDFNCSQMPTSEPPKVKELTVSKQMILVKNWLEDKFQHIQTDCNDEIRRLFAETEMRIGSELTIFDVDYTTTVRTSTDRLCIRSQGSFNTVRVNCCVYGGRWMYEIQLHTKGVMQIGWCSNQCTFNDNSGVGDTKHSYGYDGSKQQIWHIATKKYGDKWQIGDVIGVTIDIDREIIEYYRNGRSMGVAFKKIEKGPGITFYAAVSLGYTQSVMANFGNKPFAYPIPDYQPLMAKPILKIRRAELLLDYLINLSTIFTHYNEQTIQTCFSFDTDCRISTKKSVYCIFANLLVEKLTQEIFDIYVIEEVLLKRICSLTTLAEEKSNPSSKLNALLSIFWNFMEAEEIKYVIKKLVNALLTTFTCTIQKLNYEPHMRAINILHCLCLHEQTRKYLLEAKLFKKHCIALFMYLHPPEFYIMSELVPDYLAWTEGIDGPKEQYFAIVEKLRAVCKPLYFAQKDLLMTLLKNNDGSDKSPSSRKLFITKLRRYVIDLSMEQRPFHAFFFMQSSIQHPLDSPVALAFVCALVDVTRQLFKEELSGKNVEINPDFFIDGSFEYQHFDRVGGVLSHLRKVHRPDIDTRLGTDRTMQLYEDERAIMRVNEVDTTMYLLGENINSVAVVGHTQGANTTFTHFLNPRLLSNPETTPGNTDSEFSLCELLDICIIFYYSSGHKYIVKVASVRDEVAALNDFLKETKFYCEDIERKLITLEQYTNLCLSDSHSHVVAELRSKFSQRQNVFIQRSISLSRKQVWLRAVALNTHRRNLLIWLLEKMLRSLMVASQTGPLFAFVPEVYINSIPILLDTVMDFSHHDMCAQFEISDNECCINAAAEFLALHSADPRIVLASCKDSLLQALGTLTCHKPGVRALECTSKKCQIALVRALLRPYENRAWGQSNWLLLRFWLGEGFAYKDARQPCVWQGGSFPLQQGLCRSRAKNETHTGLLHNIAPANPSKHFQRLIGSKLIEDEPFCTTFLNSVLSQLNWAFSEFILLLQEIQNTALRQDNTIFEPKQLKICSMCFELTVSLMRCLEFILTVAPEIVTDASRPNSDLILNRICQLISQVLSRVTVPPGCFQFVVDMCSADLNAVTHFPIVTAALGILMALMRAEIEIEQMPQKVTRISRAFLTDPSFQFATLEFALGEIRTPISEQKEIPRGNFDPSTRPHIDPLTNDVRVPMPNTSKRIRTDPPIIKFSLSDFPTHVSKSEIEDVCRLIDNLRIKQSLLSDITLPSEDSLCPICCAKPITAVFSPCKHQSCSDCIMQHMMNSKVCFYCKTMITTIETLDGTTIYSNEESVPNPALVDQI